MEAHSDKWYVDLLRQNGVDIKDKIVLDVGCGTGKFVRHAREAGASESWGVEQCKGMLDEGASTFSLIKEDRARCLHMPFSEVPKKHPELKGKFDIIKITAVTPYASSKEMERMAHTAHFLLKKEGGGIH